MNSKLRSYSLGNTTTRIPVISQGTGGLGGYFTPNKVDDKKIINALRIGLDLGMNFIDTAEKYGGGHTEELVGQAIKGRRKEAIIATKFSPENSSSEAIMASVENSLKRLNTDYIDLYQTHWPNPGIPFEETLDTMRTIVKQGKARWIGLCNTTIKDLNFAIKFLGLDLLVSIQNEYNLLERSAETRFLDVCRSHKLTFLAYSPLLNGRSFQQQPGYKKMVEIANQYEVSIFALMLAWLVSREHVVAIPRSTNALHIQANANATNLYLDPLDLTKIDSLFNNQNTYIDPNLIDVVPAHDRIVYRTIEEAIENRNNMDPSPLEMAQEFRSGEIPKNIKLRETEQGRYTLIEGRLKYWGWVIAFNYSRPIPAIIENCNNINHGEPK